MPIDTQRLREKRRRAHYRDQFARLRYGLVGRIVGTRYEIDVAGKPNWVWVRVLRGDVVVGDLETINVGVAKIPNTPVRIDDNEDGNPEIRGLNPKEAETFLGTNAPNLGVAPHTHEIGFGLDDPVSARRIKPGLVYRRPGDPGLTVYIAPFNYKTSAGADALWPGGTIALTAPATSGKKYWVKVGVDPATNAAVATTGTEYPLTTPLTATELVAIAFTGYIPLAGVQLRNGQTTIDDETTFLDCSLLRGGGGGAATGFVKLAPATDTDNVIQPTAGTAKALVIKGHASQSDSLTEWQNSGGAVLASVNPAGDALWNSVTLQSGATTIGTDAISVGAGYLVLTSETGTSDNLATISSTPTGKTIVIRAATGHTITVKHGTGNIFLNGATDFVLSGDKALALFCNGTNWSDVGAGGSSGANTALSNLASVAINTSLVDDTDVTDDLGTAAIRWKNGYIQTVVGDTQGQIVKNTSGATANAGDAGYLDDNHEYKTTTTASDVKKWCVVLVGGANNADIYITQTGRVNVNYTGTAPSSGDYLVTSTSGGLAQRQTTMHPAIFARCRAGGSGGVVAVDLLCKSVFVPQVSSNLLWGCYSHSASDFVSTINGAPSATSVVYGAVSSGAANAIVPANAGDLGKMILWNTTRGTGRLITAVNTGTSTITTVSTTDSWANTDAITIRSQTVINAAAARFVDVDLTQQTTIPVLARNIWIMMQKLDSGGGNITQIAHPWETIASSKNKTLWYQTTNFWIDVLFPLPLINRRFAVAYGASGSGTALDEMYLQGFDLASP